VRSCRTMPCLVAHSATGAYLLLVEAAKRSLLDRATRKNEPKGGDALVISTPSLSRGEA
jgi:hypothetical protein